MENKMTRRSDLLKLGAFIYSWGYHPAAWLHPDSDVDAANDIAQLIKYAKIAEAGKMDFMFFADNPSAMTGPADVLARQPSLVNRWEPITTITALSQHTSHIGFVSTASTSFFEPYNVARMFASIDHISRGRAGWNVVTSDGDASGYNFGKEGLDPHEIRYERCEEFLDVVTGLWDTWEDDALLKDRMSGIYHDKDKIHELGHAGKYFKVRGPLNVARPPQGHPVITQAGGSEFGKELGARTSDLVFSLIGDLPRMKAFYADVKARLQHYGRSPESLKILTGLTVYVGETRAEAEAKAQQMADFVHPDVGRLMLSRFLEVDLTGVNLDEPFPRERLPEAPKGSRALFDDVMEVVGSGRTLREILALYAQKFTGNSIAGSPTEVADHIEEWFENYAADGFMLMSPTLPASLRDFTTLVVPELQRRGLFRKEYEGTTLRENLGLSRPTNRFSTR
jgi:FMN-dependent oxidoreductase (nitrilotriacetate monooxygenase family)